MTEKCIHTWFGSSHPFTDSVKLVKEAGFQWITIWWGDDFVRSGEPVKEKKLEAVRNAGLKLENAHLPFTGINSIWEDTQDGQEIFKFFSSCLDDCKNNEISKAVMHITSGGNSPPFGKTGLDRFKQLTEKAEKYGVILALENLRDLDYLDYIFENIDSDKLKFCFDSGHENCFTPHIDVLAKYGKKLAVLHLNDNDGTGDHHVLPFNGTINWQRIMMHLRNLDYKGPMALEIDGESFQKVNKCSFQDFLSEALNRVDRLLRL